MEIEVIQNKNYEIRGCKVMLDFDLALLYGVETSVLKQSIKRNISRFPADFMFIINEKEINISIIRAFVTFRQFTLTYNELKKENRRNRKSICFASSHFQARVPKFTTR